MGNNEVTKIKQGDFLSVDYQNYINWYRQDNEGSIFELVPNAPIVVVGRPFQSSFMGEYIIPVKQPTVNNQRFGIPIQFVIKNKVR